MSLDLKSEFSSGLSEFNQMAQKKSEPPPAAKSAGNLIIFHFGSAWQTVVIVHCVFSSTECIVVKYKKEDRLARGAAAKFKY